MQSKMKRRVKNLRKNLLFYILPLPGLVFLIMFCYLPMAGLYLAFERYTFTGGLFGSQFVGWKNFEFFFTNLGKALRATRNTLVINIAKIILSLISDVGLAIAVNEIRSKRYRQVTQSVMLFPYFISWIVVGSIFNVFLNEGSGIINQWLSGLGLNTVAWYSNPWYWWPILVLTSVWKGTGYGSLVYFCALTGFSQDLYEAADIDGATRWQKIFRITIPMLKPTIIIMFLLSVGGIMGGGVDWIMGMTQLNPRLLETTDTISVFVYRTAFTDGYFEFSSAITLYQSVIGFITVMICNGIVKRVDPEYRLF